MAAIWMKTETKWALQRSVPFQNEAVLHRLIAEAPAMLPLAGSPNLVVVGREVVIGPGRADLVAVERGGRVVIIEVKLARNAEARRAVVAQILTYAAHLHGLTPEEFEQDVLGSRLAEATGCATLAEAVAAEAQEGVFDAEEFRAEMASCLQAGRFRLVFVLDDAPPELVQLAGYLEEMSDRWSIDLVKVSAYEIEGRQILVPQRVDPARNEPDAPHAPPKRTPPGQLVPGADDFEAEIARGPEAQRPDLVALTAWARALEAEGLARLSTYHGKGRKVLLPRLQPENVGLVTVWNENGASLQFWRSVFERRAPRTLAKLQRLLHPFEPGQGNTVRV